MLPLTITCYHLVLLDSYVQQPIHQKLTISFIYEIIISLHLLNMSFTYLCRWCSCQTLFSPTIGHRLAHTILILCSNDNSAFRAGIHRASKMILLLHHAPLAGSPGKDALLLNTWVLGACTWVPGYQVQGTRYIWQALHVKTHSS